MRKWQAYLYLLQAGLAAFIKVVLLIFDISADLPELAQTNVAVVSAGPKAILDLPLTMEYLETHGVPVIGYGTDELPAFGLANLV